MPAPFHYRWNWSFKAAPAALWPFVADTNLTTRDSGNPPAERISQGELINAYQHLRTYILGGMVVEWEEQPFEWVRPEYFRVLRRFKSGPVKEMLVTARLEAQPAGGTNLIYEVEATARNLFGRVAIPFQVGWKMPRVFKPALDRYDQTAASRQPKMTLPAPVFFAPGGEARLATARTELLAQQAPPALVAALGNLIETADNFVVARLRPYALADAWGQPRRAVLELCLQATRLGLLTLQWDVLCPLCRGAKQSAGALEQLSGQAHCNACHIDFDANFERSVELSFRVAADVRLGLGGEFCVGGPQVTPHVTAQQLLQPGERRAVTLPLEPGRYRARAVELRGGQLLTAAAEGEPQLTITATATGWPDTEPRVNLRPTLTLANTTDREQLLILERTEWADNAVTAAEVTTLQIFRDLFSHEALRPGEKFSVGRITVLFTDLRGSTQLYRKNGDAVAFGRVMRHFDVLRAAIDEHEGALVKTIGDAVMAVFQRPVQAVQAILAAEAALATESATANLRLKAGIHTGSCVAVTLNDRLDYFGSTVNLAARLEGLSAQHQGVVISHAVHDDPEVAEWLGQHPLTATPFTAEIKGFEGETFKLWAVAPAQSTIST